MLETRSELSSHSSPASRLLPEVLEFAFIWLHKMDRHDYDCGLGVPELSTRIAFSQVCRQWRQVAINCAALWTDIPTHDTTWATLALQRSKSAPLSFRFTSASRPGATAACLSHLSRAHHVFIGDKVCRKVTKQVLDAFCVSDVPLLEELRIIEDHAFSWFIPIEVPADIFKGASPPLLRELSLSNCALSHTSPLLAGTLTKLQLSLDCPVWDSIGDMLDALHRMPLLESLSVTHSIARLSQPFTKAGSTVSRTLLPNLQDLAFQGDVRLLNPLLQHLTAPLQYKLHLDLFLQTFQEPEARAQIQVLIDTAFRNKNPPFRHYRKARFEAESGRCLLSTVFHVQSGLRPTDIDMVSRIDPIGQLPQDLYLRVSWSHSAVASHRCILQSLCDALPLDSVEEVEIDISKPLDKQANFTPAAIFSRLGAHAKSLRLRGDEASRLAFEHFPHVRSLELVDVKSLNSEHPSAPRVLLQGVASWNSQKHSRDDREKGKRHLALVRSPVSYPTADFLKAWLGEDCVKFTDSLLVKTPVM
ncbi:hypothetical protein K488DRAFT_81701 [Vararia minispora EC-137]|uniref:Uncharacterized protein n=1 Tax=Vararia minispora EC-137 TaxID=1314806 RepID=A0ACB8R0A0_9AGAM|nr:hypothetical protein K488DRAFT_81701 [Vararia minispora EC-137]